MAKGFKQTGNVENKNEEDKVPIIDNKNIVSTSNMNTMPLSQSTSLKFGKGLGTTMATRYIRWIKSYL